MNEQVTKTLEALKKNRFTTQYHESAEKAVEELLATIPLDATVGIAGSWSLMELQVSEKLEARGNVVYNHNKPGYTPEEVVELRRKELTCDVFITSTNALTEDGKLVNEDGTGNRVAAMMFGPKKVIVFTGINKIVANLEEADKRIKTIAAPKNNVRLNRPNPCTKTGYCMDCQAETRICNIRTVIEKKPPLTDIQVWLVGEKLGY